MTTADMIALGATSIAGAGLLITFDRLLTSGSRSRSFLQPGPRAGQCQMRKLLFAAASLSLLVGAPSMAAPCKDAKGRFTKCPAKAPAKPVRCKSANGKFAKCGTAGAKPV
jgi:hypothetical protein